MFRFGRMKCTVSMPWPAHLSWDLALPVEVSIAGGRSRRALNRLDRELGVDLLDHAGERDDAIRTPLLVGVEGHELDEADDDTLLPAEAGEVDDLVVVDAVHQHDVDLDRGEPGLDRCVDAVEHTVEVVATGELDEAILLERIERDVQPCQAGGVQIVGDEAERGAVRGHRKVDAELRQLPDEPAEMGTNSRFTTGEPDAVDVVAFDDESGDAFDLLEREQTLAGHPLHALFGHAVLASEVASIRDGNAEIAMHTTESVDQFHHSRLRRRPGVRKGGRDPIGEHGVPRRRALT